MADEEPIIEVRGLKNSFGEQIVHEGLDLTVRRGEILGVVGGSGTGKSVLMRSIIGLQRPDEGELPELWDQRPTRDTKWLLAEERRLLRVLKAARRRQQRQARQAA